MLIAILTLPGFNEIDSFVALNMLGRVRIQEWMIKLAAPAPYISAMNGVRFEREMPLDQLVPLMRY